MQRNDPAVSDNLIITEIEIMTGCECIHDTSRGGGCIKSHTLLTNNNMGSSRNSMYACMHQGGMHFSWLAGTRMSWVTTVVARSMWLLNECHMAVSSVCSARQNSCVHTGMQCDGP